MMNIEILKLMMLRKPDEDEIVVPKTMDSDDSVVGSSPHGGNPGTGWSEDSSVDDGD